MNKHVIHRPAAIQHFDGAVESEHLECDTIASAFHQDNRSCVPISLSFMGQGLSSLVPSFLSV